LIPGGVGSCSSPFPIESSVSDIGPSKPVPCVVRLHPLSANVSLRLG
jgi:hypothetical protein